MGTGKETGTAREGQWGRNMTKTKKGEASANREGSGDGVKKESVGGGCVGVLGVLRGLSYRLGSAPTTSVTAVMGYCSWC